MSSALAWIEVRALVPNGWGELVAEHLMVGPCTSASFGRPNLGVDAAPEGFDFVRIFLSENEDSPELRQRLRHRLGQLAELTGESELEGLELSFKRLPPEDYATSWKKSWKPFRVGRLCLLPPWDEREVRADELRLTIQPGGSFGSGRHATTRTCLRVLTRRITGGERVLDAGTGSGVLSVAAALLGAESCTGFDIDPNSTPAAGALAEDNGVSARWSASGLSAPGPTSSYATTGSLRPASLTGSSSRKRKQRLASSYVTALTSTCPSMAECWRRCAKLTVSPAGA